jgi:LPXTG-motif cell wall-anchored protein
VKKETPWWWYALGGGLLLLAALVYFLTRKKKKTPRVEAGIKDPYHTALQELESLSKNKPDTKTYYSRLTEILRLYLFRKKSLLSLHKTTDDLVIQMKDLSLSREELEKISQTLRLSDFVKFARYIPATEDDETAFINIKKTIMAVENSSASPAS